MNACTHGIWMGGAVTMVALGGCAHQHESLSQDDGRYCYAVNRKAALTCTSTVVPDEQLDRAVKQFEADRDALTVYVVRSRWSDMRNLVPVSVDGQLLGATVPESLIRVKLAPGKHTLSMNWSGTTTSQVVEGRAGDQLFTEIAGSVWGWKSSYEWASGDDHDERTRAAKARVIIDEDLRPR